MNKRVLQNALNFFLSERFSYTGQDFGVLVEIVRELQAELNGPETNQQSGYPEATPEGPGDSTGI